MSRPSTDQRIQAWWCSEDSLHCMDSPQLTEATAVKEALSWLLGKERLAKGRFESGCLLKLKSEALERMVGELNETNLQLRAVTTETEEKATNREEEMQNLEKELAEKDALVERLKLELFVGDGGEAINGEFGKAHDEVVALNHNIGKMNPEVDEIIS
nr:keratin, type II cytoskeletal 7-like isoform X3 [Ipomoea batatas]